MNVGIVRRLHAHHGEERLRRAPLLEIADEQVGELVGLVAGEPIVKRLGARAAVDPAVPLAVVVFIAGPRLKSTAPRRVGDKERGAAIALMESAEVPFAEISRVVAVGVEHVGNGLLAFG